VRCAARRPDLAAKETAWQAALAPGRFRLARAHAEGIWVPGQEDLTMPYRDRYFAEALPALGRRDHRTAQRLARLLYPATLADQATVTATDQALAALPENDPLTAVLLEQRALLTDVLTARSLAGEFSRSE